MPHDLAETRRGRTWIVGSKRRNFDHDIWQSAKPPQAFSPARHSLGIALDWTAAMVDDEQLLGKTLSESYGFLGLIGVNHQLQTEAMAGEQRDAAAKRRLVGDSGPRRKIAG